MLQINNISHSLLSFFFFLVILLNCNGEDSAFQFILQPQDRDVIQGEEITLDCQLGLNLHRQLLPLRPDSVTWLEGEERITGSDLRHVLHPNNSLTVLIDQKPDADETRHYHCNVHLPRGFVLSSRTATIGSQLSLRDELKIPSLLTVMNGTDTRISCNSKALSSWSSSRPLITWYKAGAVIGTSRDVMRSLRDGAYVLADGSLQLLGAAAADEGIYWCVVSYRSANRSSNTLKLSVQDRRTVSDDDGVLPVTNLTAFAGEEVYLHCSDAPQSSTTWRHGQNPISETERHVKYNDGGLLIRDVTVGDAGTYSCSHIKDGVGPQLMQFDLTVLSAPRYDSSPQRLYRLSPAIAEPPKVIPCSYKGFPPPTVTWLKDGRVCGPHQVDDDDNLMIQDPVSMSGYYQCVACNRLGCEQSITQICTAPQSSVESEKSTPEIRSTSYHAPSQLRVIEYSADYVRLNWSHPVDSGTMEQLTYLVSTTAADNSTRVDISFNPQATISGLMENGIYQAQVVACYTNYQGCSRASNSVHFKLTTSAEIASTITIKAKTIAATSIDIYWYPKLHSDYWDQYKVMLIDPDGIRTSVDVGKTWYSFTNLKPTTKYNIKVAGKTEDGLVGKYSSGFSVTTLQLEPKIDTAPRNVEIFDYNSTSMTITWDRIESNSTFLGYKILLKNRFSKHKSTYEVASNVTTFTLTGLVGKKEYLVRVCAFNEAGSGPMSTRISHSTSTLSLLKGENVKIPEQPEIRDTSSTATTITIKWRQPRRLSTITKYRIRWGEKTPNDRQTDLDRSVSSYTMAGLKPDTMYRVSISAIAHGTVGKETVLEPWTEEKREPVLELYPPLGVGIHVLSATSMNVSWGDKEVRKGRYYYKVRCKTSAPVEQRVRFFNTTSQFYLVEGLRAYTYYEISVCVIQGKHTSDWSMIASARSLETKPSSAPSDLTIMATPDDPTTVKVNWQPPDQPNGHLDGTLIWYTVDFNLDLSKWGLEAVLGGGLSAKIHGLTADTHYYFLAQARNDMGVGPISEMVQYRTGKSDEVSTGETRDVSMSTRNYIIYLVIGIIALLFMIVVAIATIVVCCNDKIPSLSFTKKSDSKTKRRVKYTQPSHVLRSATDLDNTAIYRTPNSSNISRQSMRCKNQTSALSNGVPSNSWSRSTLYRSKPTLYDDRRLDSFDMIPEPLAYPVTCPQMSTDDERVSIPLTNDRYLPPRDTEYTPYIAHYPYDAPLSDCAVDSAYGSDHPLNGISSMAGNQDEMTPHHRNLRPSKPAMMMMGGSEKAASSSCSSSSGGGGGGSRRTSNFRPHPPASSGRKQLVGGLMGVDELNAELADVVEFVEDMKSSADI